MSHLYGTACYDTIPSCPSSEILESRTGETVARSLYAYFVYIAHRSHTGMVIDNVRDRILLSLPSSYPSHRSPLIRPGFAGLMIHRHQLAKRMEAGKQTEKGESVHTPLKTRV